MRDADSCLRHCLWFRVYLRSRLGEQGIIWGILFLGIAALIAALSAKGMNGQKSIDAFLAEVDSVGNRDSVLAAIDAITPQSGFQAIDVRFHSFFIAYRSAMTAHIWKTTDVVWMQYSTKQYYPQDKGRMA